MPRRPAISWKAGARTILLALALLLGASAQGKDPGPPCQKEKANWDKALERAAKAREALEDYDSSPVAPVVPGQADAERQKLQDRVDATWEDVLQADKAHTKCVQKKTCKKVNLGWGCVSNWDPVRCCLDRNDEKGEDGAKGK